MSLILDALRKADAERERGSVPGLRSQPVVPLSEASAAAKRPARVGWPAIAIGVAVGLALAGTWAMLGRDSQRHDTVPAARGAPNAETVQTGTASAPSIAVGDRLPANALSPVANAAPGAAEQEIAAPAPWTRPGDVGGAPGTADGAAGPRPAGAADAPIYPRDLLPSHVRSALPQLAISGSIYSSNPAGRSLIINGRLHREKDRLSQDLALDEIRLQSAIFVFRGYRFEVLY